jgi:hypothetical protein
VKAKKFRSNKYLSVVRGESCLVCGSPPPVHAHHLRHSERRGMGQKVSDKFVVPLCWVCHSDCHTRGNESEWWALNGIDAIEWANNSFKGWRDENE